MTGRYTVDRNGNVTERPVSPAEERATLIHIARVYLTEARARRLRAYPRRRAGHHSLLNWAGNTRREAFAIDLAPTQGSLFA